VFGDYYSEDQMRAFVMTSSKIDVESIYIQHNSNYKEQMDKYSSNKYIWDETIEDFKEYTLSGDYKLILNYMKESEKKQEKKEIKLDQDDILKINLNENRLDIDGNHLTWNDMNNEYENYKYEYRIRLFNDSGEEWNRVYDSGNILRNSFDLTGKVSPGNYILRTEVRRFTGDNEFYTSRYDWHTRATVEPVPEPATMLLFGSGILGLAVFFRKKCR
jgi:hypothetical protein